MSGSDVLCGCVGPWVVSYRLLLDDYSWRVREAAHKVRKGGEGRGREGKGVEGRGREGKGGKESFFFFCCCFFYSLCAPFFPSFIIDF